MGNLRRKAAFWAMVACLLGACSAFHQIQDKRLLNQVENERMQWHQQNIASYEIEIREVSIWYEYQVKIQVENETATLLESACGKGYFDPEGSACERILSNLNLKDHTVNGLFKEIESLHREFLGNGKRDIGFNETIQIVFDEDFHFPREIRYNDPGWLDEELTIIVVDFNVIIP